MFDRHELALMTGRARWMTRSLLRRYAIREWWAL